MPLRPPKKWFEDCVKSVGEVARVDDPKALCGWVWHHHLSLKKKRKILKKEEGE